MYIAPISSSLNIPFKSVESTIALLKEGATIPFISRYRKEATGNLDEVQIGAIKDLLAKLEEITKRREAIIKSIESQDLMTPELRKKIEDARTLIDLEDIYLPYKPKRKTRASVAKELGLEPLAKSILRQEVNDLSELAVPFLTDEVEDEEKALQGARDIIAEWVSENATVKARLRNLYTKEAIVGSKVVKSKATEAVKYKDYFDFDERLNKCPSHRYLAMLRGEEEGFLRISIEPPKEKALDIMNQAYVKGNNNSAKQVKLACEDSYKRLISSSLETEFRKTSKETADTEAIKVFANNLQQLLLAPALGSKRIMGIDPGFKSGCKIVCLDEHGTLLHNQTVYPHPPQNEDVMAMKKIRTLVEQYKIDAIAIGNGTAGRETESLVKKIRFNTDVQAYVISEAGASVYSASAVAREEFPDYDVTVRGSVSIGRRLMDPLAELVKIDPKAIGVGQYQHFVDQNQLKESLDTVVESAVNHVGVELNTSSKHLLSYVSGLGPQLAQNIVDYRSEHGSIKSRSELKKVKRMGEKAFEQCAGFLRIKDGKEALDNSAVHPESYWVVKKMAKDLGCTTAELMGSKELTSKIDIKRYEGPKIGLATLKDILQELDKPGRDPRGKVEAFEFANGVHKIEDLREGSIIPGIVTNVTNFGAFVDVGVKQDGLVHISNLANEFISDPSKYVKLNQQVQVKVLEVDVARKRIQLSMKDL